MEKIKQLKEKIQDIEIELKNLKYQIEDFTADQQDQIRDRLANRPHLVKRVIKYMAEGLNKSDSILKTSIDYNVPLIWVSAAFAQQNRYMTAVNLYAKKYAAQKLKKYGLSNDVIAEILGVSKNHVYKLLKANIDFSLLK